MGYNLLSVSSDAKTTKGEKYKYLTGILYLAPANLSGKNLCPGSTAGCRAACLNYSGRSVAFPKIHQARIRKSKLYNENKDEFVRQLFSDIWKLEKEAKKIGFKASLRLNGTSDIDFSDLRINGKNVFETFPGVLFYDYTKVFARFANNNYKNYHLTFSLSEKNEKHSELLIQMGKNVAVVFNGVLPKTYFSRPVINGDRHDLRFLDTKLGRKLAKKQGLDVKKGYVVGLRAKYNAKKDQTGFVKNIKKGNHVQEKI